MHRLALSAFFTVCLIGLGTLGHPAQAAETVVAPAVSSIPVLQEWQQASKADVNYIGTRHGLDVWIATRDSMLQVLYTTPDKQAMLFEGSLIGPGGTDITNALQRDFVAQNPQKAEAMLQTVSGKQLDATAPSAAPPATDTPVAVAEALAPSAAQPVPASKLSKSELLWSDLAQATTISFGNPSAPLAYVVVDLACNHCKDLWQQLQPAIAANVVQVKLLPIAILGPKSESKATSLLSQPDPVKAWLAHAKDGTDTTSVTAGGKAAFTVNQALAAAYKLYTTPIMIYRSTAQQKVKMVLGNPKSMESVWQDLGTPAAAAPADSTVKSN